jgi:carbonic anhydrase
VLAFSGLAAAGLSAEQQKPTVLDPRLDELIRRGATMEEVAKVKDPVATNPEQAVRALKMGNARFCGGQAQRPEASAAERRSQILGQTPFGVVLSCSDSRVPTEIVFDQGLGDLFITRVAGNVVDRTTLGSIEYAIGHLKTHVVVVMGHEGCGAVKAALLPPEDRGRETENIQFLLDQIVPSVKNLPATVTRRRRCGRPLSLTSVSRCRTSRMSRSFRTRSGRRRSSSSGRFTRSPVARSIFSRRKKSCG